MRINTNVMAMNTHRLYTINTSSAATATDTFSSSHRASGAGDSAAGSAVSERMRTQIQGLKAASKDTSDGISLVQTAQGALQEVQSTLQRMQELSAMAADTGEPGIDRAALDKEFQQLAQKLESVASDTRFNGRGVIDGTYADAVTPASLKAAAVSALGDNAQTAWEANPIVIRTGPNLSEELRVSVADMRAASLGVSGLSVADAQSAGEAASRLEGALSAVSAEQASLGALEGKLHESIQTLATSAENISAAKSRISDFDIAAEVTNYTRNSILQQGNTAVLAQARNVPQSLVLSLLD